MFTMTSMAFAQISGGPIVEESDYLTITNTTTKESKKVPFSKFTSSGNNKYTYDVDFCLGVYQGDKIEITYTPKVSLKPQIAWSYSWNGGLSTSLGTAFTANLSVNTVPYNGSDLTITCNYQNGIGGASIFYNIHLKNVHDGKRIYIQHDNTLVRLYYENYAKEVMSCANQFATTALYDLSNNMISTGGFNTFGFGTLAINEHTGILVVKVLVNNVDIFTEKISVP